MSKKLQKTISIFTSVTTILWLSGIAMLAPIQVSAVDIADGDLIRNPNAEGMAQFDVYIVKIVGEKKFKRLILSPHVFESYGHLKWENIKDVDQATMDSFTTSDLVRADGDTKVYKLTADGDTGTKQWLNMTAEEFEAAGYDWDSIYTINTVDRDAYTVGEEVTAGAEEEAAEGELEVAISADTPVTTTLVAGQALADLVHFVFTNNGGQDVKVTTLKVKRIGVSADNTLSNLYLYDGTKRLTDNVTVSSGYATFNDPTGLFTVAANASVVIAVKADIKSATSGQTVGVAINSADDVTSDAESITGTFPLNGNLMSIASATLATVSVGPAEPSSAVSVDPGELGYSVWKSDLNVSERDVYLHYLRLRMIGSIDGDDLQNFKLYVDGEQVGSTIEVLSGETYTLTFDLTAEPKKLKTGTHALEVKADIIDGSAKQFSFSLRYKPDLVVVDSEYNVNVLVGGTVPATTAEVSVNSGTMSVAKATDSPSDKVILDGSDVLLAKYKLTAYGEEIKVETLKVKIASGDTNVTELRNGKLYADGVQVGSTADITTTGTTYNLGSSLIVKPGTPVMLEVRADIYDSDGTNDISDGDTLTVTLMAGSNNAQCQTSLILRDVPAGPKAANQVTVSTGGLTLTKDGAYGNQYAVAGTVFKLGDYVLRADSAEDINISGFTVGINASSTLFTGVNGITDLYVKYGDNQTTPKATVSDSNEFNVSYTLTKNSQIPVEIWGTLPEDVANDNTVSTTLAIAAKGADTTANANVSAVTGQDITIKTGSISAKLDSANTPTAAIVKAGGEAIVGQWKASAQYEDFTISEIKVAVSSGDENSVTGVLLDGVTPEYLELQDGVAHFTGLSINVPANGSTLLKVKAKFNQIGSGYGDSGDDPTFDITAWTYTSASGKTKATLADPGVAPSNIMVVRKAMPMVAKQTLTSTGLTDGVFAKFSVTGDGTISVKKIKVRLSGSVGGDTIGVSTANTSGVATSSDATVAIKDFSLLVDGTTLPATVTYANGNSSSTVSFVLDNELEIGSTAKTFEVRGVLNVSLTSGDIVTTVIPDTDVTVATDTYANIAGTVTSFVWSDMSAVGHSLTTADWTNDYLVKDIKGNACSWTRSQ
jgi:hypothetical protein